MNKAQEIRYMLVSGDYFAAPDDTTMISNMKAACLEAKAELFTLNNQEVARDTIQSIRLKLFFPSLVLVSFGDKDAIEYVLAMYNHMPRPIQNVGNYMYHIVPLPIHVDISAKLEWLRDNKEHLEWDSEQELFLLSDS